MFAGYYTDIDGDVAFTVYDAAHTETGKGDEIEFSISMKKLADYLGINIDQGRLSQCPTLISARRA